ncbi:MAG: hypothetical protein A3J52_03920 [Omnitrophica bacterium RIFCSPHIGHO2_02_FULL_49_9]|nr:MAG: hypothetical protein A3J52_03920 [Omnitrophica bacterium RIFCSPHIGHO2_02_FULL_49_9]
MKSITRKYALTAFLIVIILIGFVVVARTIRKQVPLSTEQARQLGPKDAPVRMIVYSDFQCPACKIALDPLHKLMDEFPNLIQIGFKYYPIERAHKNALLAAQFAECAGAQGKFWAFHDRLFSEQAYWSAEDRAVSIFAGYARELDLDLTALRDCATHPEVIERIRRERTEGAAIGVRSTPTFFIGERMVAGGDQLAAEGSTIVREELKKFGIDS